MAQIGSELGQTATADRTVREIEGLIELARELRADGQNISGRLYDMRSRLLGLGEPECATPGTIKEAVTSEVHDLRGTLNDLHSVLIDAKKYLADLEGV